MLYIYIYVYLVVCIVASLQRHSILYVCMQKDPVSTRVLSKQDLHPDSTKLSRVICTYLLPKNNGDSIESYSIHKANTPNVV